MDQISNSISHQGALPVLSGIEVAGTGKLTLMNSKINSGVKLLFSESGKLVLGEGVNLVVDYCKKENATVLVRGVRNAMDFAHEFDLSLMNRQLGSDIETLFLPTEQKYFLVRSSSIKEAARFGGDISKMVPPLVEKALKEKFDGK